MQEKLHCIVRKKQLFFPGGDCGSDEVVAQKRRASSISDSRIAIRAFIDLENIECD